MANHQTLTPENHRDLRIYTEPKAELGDGVMATMIIPEEFRRVQSELPIVFRRTQEGDTFVPLALFGFENGENLFLNAGKWEARYRPLTLAIQPFLPLASM